MAFFFKISRMIFFIAFAFKGLTIVADSPAAEGKVAAAPYKRELLDAEREFEVGISLPTSGGVAFLGNDFLSGINVVFNKFNKSDAAKKFLLRLSPLDDRYEMSITKSNIEKLLKKSPFFFGLFGTSAFQVSKDKVSDRKMAVLFPVTGSKVSRDSGLVGVINWRASLYEELEVLIEHAVKDLCKDKIAIFYEDGGWGLEGCDMAKEILKKYKLTPLAAGAYPSGTVTVDKVTTAISKAQPTAVICISHSRATYSFIQGVMNQGLSNCAFLGTSDLTPMQRRIKASRGISLILSEVVPDPEKSDLPLVKRFRDDVKQYLPKLLPNLATAAFALEGYIYATFFVEVLKTLEPPFTVEKIFKAFEEKAKIDLGGIILGFDPSTRQFSRNVWLNKGEGAAWQLVRPKAVA